MINAIFAIDQEGGMGVNNSLPWGRQEKDLDWFKMHTVGHIVVMGRGTWDSTDMPKPLPRRTNWVVTSGNIEPNLSGAYTWHSDPIKLIYKLERENPSKTVWVIGGAKLLTSLSGLFDRLYVTHFVGDFGCDAKINFTELSQGYKKIYNKEHFGVEHAIYGKLS